MQQSNAETVHFSRRTMDRISLGRLNLCRNHDFNACSCSSVADVQLLDTFENLSQTLSIQSHFTGKGGHGGSLFP